ncbi:MAG TPA: FMN-binding protein [Chloroflexota bacterium]|nr:FMN-binding protein [Chloroflexota bacterium]
MTHPRIKRRVLPLTIATLAAGGMLSSPHALAAAGAKKYKGAVIDQGRWGPIQVTITVKNRKITNVAAAVSPDNPRSSMIESRALPLLKQEVLQAQRANIQLVSGATDTSDGYLTSLQSAVKKAIKARALTTKAL